MIRQKNKTIFALVLMVILGLSTLGFAESIGVAPKQRTMDEMRLELQKTIEGIQTLKVEIRNQTEKIKFRIEKVKKNLAELIKETDQLEDDQINDLKSMAKDLEFARTTIKTGLDTIKELQLKIKEAVDAKERKAVFLLYRELYRAQKDYLFRLKEINMTLLTDLEQLIELR